MTKTKTTKKGNSGKVRISFINDDGDKLYRYVTRLQLKEIYKVINYTIE